MIVHPSREEEVRNEREELVPVSANHSGLLLRATACWRCTRSCAWSAATSAAWRKTWTKSRSVSTSTRTLPWTPPRAFLIKYRDRVLYGTDLELKPWEKPEEALKRWEAEIARDWKFFASHEKFQYAGREVRGLALPENVLQKFYRQNALRWVPGIAGAK